MTAKAKKRFKLLQQNICHIKLKGYQTYHNYIREHSGLDGKTPAQVFGIEIQGRNKWLTLIQNASKTQNHKTQSTL
jgi:hypothetical protein